MYIEFLPGEKFAPKNANKSITHQYFRDCGYLIEEDEIIVDIDELPKTSIEALIKTFGVDTETVWTDRGAHFYFKKPAGYRRQQSGVCVLGFKIEHHTKRSRPSGITVKRNGELRRIENFGKRETMPDIFALAKNKYNNLNGLENGDNRNQLLFTHTAEIAGRDDADTILRFINEYVFAEPLAEKEFQTVTRNRARKRQSNASEKIDIAKEVVKNYRTVDYGGLIWYYDAEKDKYMQDAGLKQIEKMLYRDYDQDAAFTKGILDQIPGRSKFIEDGTVFPIRVNNGIIHKGRFIEYDEYPEFTPYKIDITYNENATPVQIVDDYINNLTDGDESYKRLLMEIVGYVMITDHVRINSLAKFFFFRGDGANGKSTLFNIMRKIYGKENCTNISIKQITDPRYNVTMIGKLANLGDDVEPDAINNDQMKMLKNIATADSINTRHLYAESRPAVITAKLYFTTNSEIKSFEKGYAFQRRVLWLPMFNKVEKPDPSFVDKITSEAALEYWLRLIVEGYMRLYTTGTWSHADAVNKFNEEYHVNNNAMLEFANDLGEDGILDCTMSEIKAKFTDWNSDESIRFSGKLFKAAAWDLFKIGVAVKRTGTVTKKVFLRQCDTTQNLNH